MGVRPRRGQSLCRAISWATDTMLSKIMLAHNRYIRWGIISVVRDIFCLFLLDAKRILWGYLSQTYMVAMKEVICDIGAVAFRTIGQVTVVT